MLRETNSPPVHQHRHQQNEAEEREHGHHHQGHDPLHHARHGHRVPGHVQEAIPIWRVGIKRQGRVRDKPLEKSTTTFSGCELRQQIEMGGGWEGFDNDPLQRFSMLHSSRCCHLITTNKAGSERARVRKLVRFSKINHCVH